MPTEELHLKCDRECLSELHGLLDLVQADGSMHDLDIQNPQTMLGEVLLELMQKLEFTESKLADCERRNEEMRQAAWKIDRCAICGGTTYDLADDESMCEC